MKVTKGRKVVVHYRGTLDGGEEFDSSEGREPLEFVVGDGDLIPGFEKALLGMEAGQKKKVTLEPEDAYGAYEDQLVIEGPRNAFPEGELQVGQSYTVHLHGGEEAIGRVLRIEKDTVALDFNHPLAGKRLTFDLHVVSVA
jgi:FKBP-type peptidyl-prolyl cis-trans isomerase 2